MTWPAARQQLLTVLRTLDVEVRRVPPQTLDAPGPIIYLIPPARTVERRASAVRRTTYMQRIMIMAQVPSEGDADIDAVSIVVDDLVEGVNDALDTSIQLGGHAVAAAEPVWAEMVVEDFPKGSGQYYAMMDGTVQIEVEKISAFAP